MQQLGLNYGFQTVFGFTDSIFVRHNNTNDKSTMTCLITESKIDKTELRITPVGQNVGLSIKENDTIGLIDVFYPLRSNNKLKR